MPAGRVRWRLPKAERIIRPSNLETRNFCVFFVKNSVFVPEPKNTELIFFKPIEKTRNFFTFYFPNPFTFVRNSHSIIL